MSASSGDLPSWLLPEVRNNNGRCVALGLGKYEPPSGYLVSSFLVVKENPIRGAEAPTHG